MVGNVRERTVNKEEQIIEEFTAPYNRIVKMENVAHESGMQMLRLHIREGRRFTIMDLDKETALKMGKLLLTWAEE